MSKEEFWFWVRGSLRSLTMWFATLVALTPVWWPEVHPLLADLLGSESRATKVLTTLMAITIVWLRVRGPAETIPQKGGKTDAPLA
jgi:hypothetical protein